MLTKADAVDAMIRKFDIEDNRGNRRSIAYTLEGYAEAVIYQMRLRFENGLSAATRGMVESVRAEWSGSKVEANDGGEGEQVERKTKGAKGGSL